MRFLSSVLAALALAPLSAMAVKEVFAQYLVGVTNGQIRSDWDSDIKLAKASNIDGFALTIRSTDSWNAAQLALAYESAQANDFSVYISFDMACSCGEWSVAQVVKYINSTKSLPAQFKVDGRPMVSTVDGYDFINKWADVRVGAGGLFFVPSWSDLGTLMWDFASLVDGAASFIAWTGMTGEDYGLIAALQGKPYMMPVSPWFYTDALKSTKNYNLKSDTLWHDRWEQVLRAKPNFLQIISWNDYASSHYIGPIRAQSVAQAGAEVYVDSTHSHDGWRMILPYYIKAFKAGAEIITVDTEGASFWYRTTPKSICSNGGTSCTANSVSGAGAAEKCVNDSIYVVTALRQAQALSVRIGTSGVGTRITAAAGVNFYEVPFTGSEGAVEISLNGAAAPAGPPIVNKCPASGHVNFNAYAGQLLF